jgi:Ca-activated chloride channel family protein
MKINKKYAKTYALYALGCLCAGAFAYTALWYYFKDISFASPWVLYFIIPLFALCALGAVIKRVFIPSLKYPLPGDVAPLYTASAHIINWTAFTLIVIALFLCILALARPREEGKTALPPTKGIDIIMAIDISQSMDAVDFSPNRIGAAKSTADEFIKKRTSDRIGLVVFDDLCLLQCPLTLDYFAVYEYLKMVNIGMIGGTGGTAIGDAVTLAARHLKDSAAKSKVIVLLTDGENNSGAVDPLAAAKAAQTLGIKIYSIAMSADGAVQRPIESIYGTKKYVPTAPISKEGEALLAEMARITGGEFFRARNNIDLQSIYSKIDSLEKTEFEETIQLNYKDKYSPFLIWALVLSVLSFVLDKFVFIKIP